MKKSKNFDSKLSVKDFYVGLSSKVNGYDAKLLLRSALIGCGVSYSNVHEETPLAPVDAKSICLELIRAGGPSFQIGREMYKKI